MSRPLRTPLGVRARAFACECDGRTGALDVDLTIRLHAGIVVVHVREGVLSELGFRGGPVGSDVFEERAKLQCWSTYYAHELVE